MVNETKNAVVSRSMTGAQNSEPRISSIEIAQLVGKPHNDVMKAIRKMEEAWMKACQGNFSLTSRTIIQPNGGTREVPCYSLNKTECLYIATKFNDEARAKLVLRWKELEMEDVRRKMSDGSMQKLLVTEEDILNEAQRIIGRAILSFNQNADGCVTASEIANVIGIDVKDLNSWLMDKEVQVWKHGRYYLTPKYEGQGLARDRLFSYYSKKGKKKERMYLVWTQKGAKMIEGLIRS